MNEYFVRLAIAERYRWGLLAAAVPFVPELSSLHTPMDADQRIVVAVEALAIAEHRPLSASEKVRRAWSGGSA